MLQLIENACLHSEKIAISANLQTYTFQDLLDKSAKIAGILLNKATDLDEMRVAFMVSPGFDYVAVQWGIWRAGGIAVPLCITYPPPSLQYVLDDTQAEIVIAGSEYETILQPLAEKANARFLTFSDFITIEKVYLPDVSSERSAMILYTSGTTNLPKGVVTTHGIIEAQVTTLVQAWKWTSADYTLCILPLHHVHGIINVISCALWAGATVEFLPSFSAEAVFQAFARKQINVFMAVPTIYFKLIAHWENLELAAQKDISALLSQFRFMVSGSAALPVSVMEKWKTISNHTLLERYGMTEIGMGISNPYDGERKAGYIGQPLPSVLVRLCNENNEIVTAEQAGEIQIKGPSVFKEYWRKPQATANAFTADGWFKTGDVAVVEKGYYKILGRDSIDIIKSGGYKISALEIEEVLRTHPEISDCGVVGITDEEWGELVVAALVIYDKELNISELSDWIRERMPAYKTPRRYVILDELPRNAMGKVTKNDLKKMF